MIQTAIADVVGPGVAAHNPLGRFEEIVPALIDRPDGFLLRAQPLHGGDQAVRPLAGPVAVVKTGQTFSGRTAQFFSLNTLRHMLHL